MMTSAGRRRFNRATRTALLGTLFLVSLAGTQARPGVVAQEIQATPLTDDAAVSFGPASSALTLTISSGHVDFGNLWTGETAQIESAAVVTVSETAGVPWQLSCSAAPTAAHTTDLPVTALEYARAGTSEWAAFQASPTPCTETISSDATMRFNYRVQVPLFTTPGAFEVVVTYSVAAIE